MHALFSFPKLSTLVRENVDKVSHLCHLWADPSTD